MALKGDRYEGVTDISFFMDSTATRGGVVCVSTGGSGVALDQSAALVVYSDNPSSNVPLGLLLNDMVDIDQTRQHINFHKNEVQKGGKVTLLKQGWVVTSNIHSGTSSTCAAGDLAFLTSSGNLSNDADMAAATRGDAACPAVGRFLSSVDEDGYAKVEIQLPTNMGRNSFA